MRLAWYVATTNLRIGKDAKEAPPVEGAYRPWYAGRFSGIDEVTAYWRERYAELRKMAQRFSDCFYASTLPPEVIEAVAANLTILKSPTVLRQRDGRLWAFDEIHRYRAWRRFLKRRSPPSSGCRTSVPSRP